MFKKILNLIIPLFCVETALSKVITASEPLKCNNNIDINFGDDCFVHEWFKNENGQLFGTLNCDYKRYALLRFENSVIENDQLPNYEEVFNTTVTKNSIEYDLATACGYKTIIKRKYTEINEHLSRLIQLLQKYDSKVSKEERLDLQNPKNLYQGADNYDDIAESIYNLFKQDNLSKKTSQNMISTLALVINSFKERLSNSIYNDYHALTEQVIDRMEIYLLECCKLYNQNFKDSENYVEKYRQQLINYNNNDSASKYFTLRLLKLIDDLVRIVNENEGHLDGGIGFKISTYGSQTRLQFLSVINHFTIDKDSKDTFDAIDRLCEKIEHLDPAYKEIMKNYLAKIDLLYQGIQNKDPSIIYASYSDILHNLYIALHSYVKGDHDYRTERIEKPTNNNQLSIRTLIDSDIYCLDCGKDIPYELVPYVYKGLQYELTQDLKNSVLYVVSTKKRSLTNLMIFYFNEINSRDKLYTFLSEIAEYNKYYTFAISNGYLPQDSNYNEPLELGDNFKTFIKRKYSRELEDIFNQVIKAHPDQFNDDLHYDRNKFEYTVENLKKAIKNAEDKKTKEELMNIFIEAAGTDPILKMKLQRTYELKFLFLLCSNPVDRDIEMIRDVFAHRDLIPISSTMNYQSFYHYMYDTLLKFMTQVSQFDRHATPQTYEWNSEGLNPSSIYENAKSFSDIYAGLQSTIVQLDKNDLMTEEIAQQVDDAAKTLNKCIRGSRYLVEKTIGRVPTHIYDKMVKDYYDVFSGAELYFKGNTRIDNDTEFDMIYTDNHQDESIAKLYGYQRTGDAILNKYQSGGTYRNYMNDFERYGLNKEKI